MTTIYDDVKTVLNDARTDAYRAVNFARAHAYWQTGQLIVSEEQQGKSRAEYGTGLLKCLAQRLAEDFGKGFDEPESDTCLKQPSKPGAAGHRNDK